MRIIAGKRKGKTLWLPPKGSKMRPTQDRIKENIFNILQPLAQGSRVLDLFAGTGQIGLEFLSRGAGFCRFVERDPTHFEVLKANVKAAEFEDQADCVHADYRQALAHDQDVYDYVFLDPPYGFKWEEEILTSLLEAQVLHGGSLVVMETNEETVMSDFESLDLVFDRTYKKKRIQILKEMGR